MSKKIIMGVILIITLLVSGGVFKNVAKKQLGVGGQLEYC